MPLYVIVHDSSNVDSDTHANRRVQVMIYVDDVLPVFTSLESLWEFARAQHSAQDPIHPTPLEVDPLSLATMAEQLVAREGLKQLVYDPKITPSGLWVLQNAVSARSYCRYTLEFALGTKRLFAEGRAMFEDLCSSDEERDELVFRWAIPQAERIDAEARARMEEWETEDDSWYWE